MQLNNKADGILFLSLISGRNAENRKDFGRNLKKIRRNAEKLQKFGRKLEAMQKFGRKSEQGIPEGFCKKCSKSQKLHFFAPVPKYLVKAKVF